MALIGSLATNYSGGFIQPNQTFDGTFTLTNTGAAAVNVNTIQGYLLSNGQPFPSGVVGTMTPNPQNVATVNAGSSLTYSFGVVVQTPAGSPETGLAMTQVSTQAITLNVTCTTSDGSVTNTQMTLTPVQLGAAAATAAGQFLFNSPPSSPLWFFFF
jgi:hypothetical protein